MGLLDGIIDEVVEKFDSNFKDLMKEIKSIDKRLSAIERMLKK
jgi:flagellar capping protein FliD